MSIRLAVIALAVGGLAFAACGGNAAIAQDNGEHVDRGPPKARDFIRIPPGVKFARRFCLYYDFTKPGRYQVNVAPQREDWLASACKAYYDGDAEDASANRDNVWSGKLSSNAVSVNVVGATSESAREETAAADSIFEHVGLSGDPVISLRISHAPKGDFDSEHHPSQSTDNTIPIGQLVEILKQLPASGSNYKKFAKDIEQWRIELTTQSGKTHQLTFYGIRLRSPQTKGGSFYNGPLEEEKRLLELVRRVYFAEADWGKPSGGLQCRLLPTKQTVTVKPDQEADDTPMFMTFELREVGGHGVRLLPWYTPLEGIGYPMFEVIGPDGEEVKYDGPRVDRPPATPRDYIKIPRRVKLTRRFRLPYDLTKPGPHRVTFRMQLPTKPDDWYYEGDLERAKENPDNVWSGELVSNNVTVHIAQAAEHRRIGTGRLRSNTVAVEIAPSVGEILGAVDLEPPQMATLRKWIGRVDVRQWIANQPSRPVDPAALADFLKTLPIDFDKQEMAILTTLGSMWGKAVGGLQCRLEPSRQTVEVAPGARPEDIKVYVMYRLRNLTARPITFLPEDTPLGPGREMWLRADRADGKEVSGWVEHTSFPPAGKGDYVVVPPGGELKQRVRLKYDLTTPGSYRVWSQTLDRVRLDPTNSAVRRYYDGDTDRAAKNLDNVWTGQLRSNTATVDVIFPATKAGGASGVDRREADPRRMSKPVPSRTKLPTRRTSP